MGESREFYIVPEGWPVKIKCHQCKRELAAGDEYYMTDDSSWIYCKTCASGREQPRGPRARLYGPHERAPLHKRETLREQVERCQM
jgi:hypothetical protein